MAGRARVSGVAYRILRLVLLPRSESSRRVYRGSHATDRHSRERGQTSADVRSKHGAPKGSLLVSHRRSTRCTRIRKRCADADDLLMSCVKHHRSTSKAKSRTMTKGLC